MEKDFKTISYAVTVCDEFIEIQRLLSLLINGIKAFDEIVVLVDLSKNKPTSELLGYLHKLSSNGKINLIEDHFKGHFADWKNLLTKHCSKDYIYQIDADEMINPQMFDILQDILIQNDIDVMRVPRINTVKGLTQEHIQKWGWRVNENNWVNFPDYQFRIYKNTPEIKWKNKVHEVLEGFKTIADLPTNETLCLIHEKTIEKQEKQNEYYEKF